MNFPIIQQGVESYKRVPQITEATEQLKGVHRVSKYTTEQLNIYYINVKKACFLLFLLYSLCTPFNCSALGFSDNILPCH